jgi:hypothetical protein
VTEKRIANPLKSENGNESVRDGEPMTHLIVGIKRIAVIEDLTIGTISASEGPMSVATFRQ